MRAVFLSLKTESLITSQILILMKYIILAAYTFRSKVLKIKLLTIPELLPRGIFSFQAQEHRTLSFDYQVTSHMHRS